MNSELEKKLIIHINPDITLRNLNDESANEIKQWRNDNCKQKFSMATSWINGNVILRFKFENKNDLILFKLIWG